MKNQLIILIFVFCYVASHQDFINAFNKQHINENRIEFCTGIYEHLCSHEFHQLESVNGDGINKMTLLSKIHYDHFIRRIKTIRDQERKRKFFKQKILLMKLRKHFLDRHL
jgi:hypothetical protein